jgi:hypothetical protein
VSNEVLRLKGWVSFLIPFLVALSGGLGSYALPGVPRPTVIATIIIASAALVAGLSGLSSFLSTEFADHKAKQDTNTAAPVTVIPVVPVIPVSQPPQPVVSAEPVKS